MTRGRGWAVGLSMVFAACLLGGCATSSKTAPTSSGAGVQRAGPPVDPLVAEKDAFTVVGVEMTDANTRSSFIMLDWVAMASKGHLIENKKDPDLLYGVWWRRPGADEPSYVAGFEVSGAASVPPGMVVVEVPAARYVMVEHRGSMRHVAASYDRAIQWGRNNGMQFGGGGVTHEVYDASQPITDDYRVLIYEPVQ